jgi:hypothetical protein
MARASRLTVSDSRARDDLGPTASERVESEFVPVTVFADESAPALAAVVYVTSKASTTTQLQQPAGFHVPVTLIVIV